MSKPNLSIRVIILLLIIPIQTTILSGQNSIFFSTSATSYSYFPGPSGEVVTNSSASLLLTAAIERLKPNGGKITFEPGTYKFDAQVVIEGLQNVSFSANHGVVFTLDPDADLAPDAILDIKESANLHFSQFTFRKAGTAFNINSTSDFTLEQCNFYQHSNIPIKISDSEIVTVSRCRVDSAYDAGIHIDACKTTWISNSVIRYIGKYSSTGFEVSSGLFVVNSLHTVVDGNLFENHASDLINPDVSTTTDRGVYVGGKTKNVRIVNNTFQYMPVGAIYCESNNSDRLSGISAGHNYISLCNGGITTNANNMAISSNSFNQTSSSINIHQSNNVFGRRITITDNFISNAGLPGGIVIYRSTIAGLDNEYFSIRDNHIMWDEGFEGLQKAIEVGQNIKKVTLENNSIIGNKPESTGMSSQYLSLAENVGYITEQRGTISINLVFDEPDLALPSASKRVVAHGLRLRPNHVLLTPENKKLVVWVSDINDETFTINWRNCCRTIDTPSGNIGATISVAEKQKIHWSARVQ